MARQGVEIPLLENLGIKKAAKRDEDQPKITKSEKRAKSETKG
jgi:hypothetical protein